jgi:hypothetical protein
VHPLGVEIHGQSSYKQIDDISCQVDTVTLYVGKERSTKMMDKILSMKPDRIIMNPGAENDLLETKAKEYNIEVIRGCTLNAIYTVAFVRSLTTPHIRITNEFLFLFPSPFWKSYKISISDIKWIQQIELEERGGFIFHKWDGTQLKYIPVMQDDKLINDLTNIITSVDDLNKRLMRQRKK